MIIQIRRYFFSEFCNKDVIPITKYYLKVVYNATKKLGFPLKDLFARFCILKYLNYFKIIFVESLKMRSQSNKQTFTMY